MTLLEYLRQVSTELQDINAELDKLMEKVEELGNIPADLTQPKEK